MQRSQDIKNLGISKKQSAAISSIGLDIDNKITFDKKIVANTFNHCFSTIAAHLVAKLPDISLKHSTFRSSVTADFFSILCIF